MTETQDLMSMAGQTTAVGMSVVFIALFLLSVYMNIFKRILARFEGEKKRKAAPPQKAAAPAPQVAAAADADEEQTVAAIALGLHLDGFKPGGIPADVAAVIMTALHLNMQAAMAETAAIASAARASAPAGEWKISGWLETHGARQALQARRF